MFDPFAVLLTRCSCLDASVKSLAKHILPTGEGEDAEDDEQKGPELKQASRRDMYTICQTAGLGKGCALCHAELAVAWPACSSEWRGLLGEGGLVVLLSINYSTHILIGFVGFFLTRWPG